MGGICRSRLADNKKAPNYFFVEVFHDVVVGATKPDQIKTYYDNFTPSLLGAYKDPEIVTQEHITRDGHPAYHLIYFVPSEGEKVRYEVYLFMANADDLIMVMQGGLESAQTENAAEFMDFVRGIHTADTVI